MKAWRFTEVGVPLTRSEVPTPVAGPHEVVIHVRAAGLCHSDVGFVTGPLAGILPFRPITLGHEIAGIVSSVGSEVTAYAVGDRVIVQAAVEGPGTSLDGGFADEVVVKEHLVAPLPDGVPWEQAAAATDAGLTSYHAMKIQGRVKAGDKVGLIGFGGLGSLGAQVAIAAGAELYVAENNERVHDFARELGAKEVATSITAFADVALDVIVDYAGFGTTTAEAIETVRPGGRVVLVGLGRTKAEIDWQTLIFNETEVVGSAVGSRQDLVDVVDLVARGDLTSRVTTIGFDEIGDGVGRLERGEVIGRLVALFGE